MQFHKATQILDRLTTILQSQPDVHSNFTERGFQWWNGKWYSDCFTEVACDAIRNIVKNDIGKYDALSTPNCITSGTFKAVLQIRVYPSRNQYCTVALQYVFASHSSELERCDCPDEATLHSILTSANDDTWTRVLAHAKNKYQHLVSVKTEGSSDKFQFWIRSSVYVRTSIKPGSICKLTITDEMNKSIVKYNSHVTNLEVFDTLMETYAESQWANYK